MSVRLEAIQFNTKTSSATDNALNIRKNAKEIVVRPEWERNRCISPEDSPAAYAIKETAGNTINIQAEFSCANPNIKTVWVRAIDPADPPEIIPIIPQNWFQRIFYIAANFFVRMLSPFHRLRAAVNVLGKVKSQQIHFSTKPTTGLVNFTLEKTRLKQFGVGNYIVIWQWQYSTRKYGPWQDFAKSQHRIYVVLETPKKPWTQTPFDKTNIHLPWIDVLDYATSWAHNTKDTNTAAAEITESIYTLGAGPKNIIEYDCAGGGLYHYGFAPFNCTAFLERLRGKKGKGRFVSCVDCAIFVHTFANVLGCYLLPCYISTTTDVKPRRFYLNPVLGIGSKVWERPCKGWSYFEYHLVAWEGPVSKDGEVFDACLQVDADNDPSKSPHIPLLPHNMRFGKVGDGHYIDRLSDPADPHRSKVYPWGTWKNVTIK